MGGRTGLRRAGLVKAGQKARSARDLALLLRLLEQADIPK
jgi:hypothetical protein